MKKILLYFLFLIVFLFTLNYFKEAKAFEFEEWDDDFIYYETSEIGTILMEGEFLDGDILKISVLAKEMMSPVLGIAFHLIYEKEKLSFLKYEPGDFLERGGDPYYLVRTTPGDAVIFGETLRREDRFPLGDGGVADFYFQISKDENFEFKFENGVVSTLDTVRQDLNEIIWQDISLDKNKPTTANFANVAITPTKQNSNLFSSAFSSSAKLIISLSIFFFLIIISIIILLFKKYRKKG